MALNKLKKWIGTQAMTAFFDQLNDNVDATNAAIDLAEQNSANLGLLNNTLSVSGDLLAKIDTLTPGRIQAIRTVASNTNVPGDFNYATGLVLWRDSEPYVFLISHSGKFATCARSSGVWSTWRIAQY